MQQHFKCGNIQLMRYLKIMLIIIVIYVIVVIYCNNTFVRLNVTASFSVVTLLTQWLHLAAPSRYCRLL